MALRDRETLIPLLGLAGLLCAGGLMLYATSGPKAPLPPKAARVDKAKAPAKGKAKPGKPAKPTSVQLVRRGQVGDRPPAPQGAPNLVVVTACAVRRDALGPYGGPEGLTPRLEELATQGALFDDAIAAGMWTRESLAAMFTGQFAIDVGLAAQGPKPSDRSLPPDVPTVARVLAERGWWTVGVNAIPGVTAQDSALWGGFDHMRDAHPSGFKAQFRLEDAQAAQTALAMLEDRPEDRPFLLQLVLGDSHKPVRVKPGEASHWVEAGLPNGPYMATVRRADDALGAVVDWLDAKGLADRTYVVFLTDHGEGLDRPKHLGPAHGRYLGQNVARIPWVVRGPGIRPGTVVEGLASGVDVGPTLLGLAGVDGALGEIPGIDLTKSLKKGAPTGRQVAYSDTWYLQANRAAIWTQTRQCQADFGSKNLDNDGFVQGCFDRATDPDFERPLQDPALLQQLTEWRTSRSPEGP